MTHATPQRLIDLFAIADRAVTAALFEIASAIAKAEARKHDIEIIRGIITKFPA